MTKRQKCFVEEYLIDLNATQAAIRAGYSPKTAKDIGCQNLAKLNIQSAIAEQMAERSKRTGVSQDRVVRELARIAFVKLTDIVDEDGRIRSTATEDDLACLESLKCSRSEFDNGISESREVRTPSKLKALELLGKHLGMWNDKLNVSIDLPVFYEGEDQLED